MKILKPKTNSKCYTNEQRRLVNVREKSGVLNSTLILHYLLDFAVGETWKFQRLR